MSKSLLPTTRSRSSDDLKELIARSHAQLDARLSHVSSELEHIRSTTDRTHDLAEKIDLKMSIHKELITQVLRSTGVSREVWFIRGLLLALVIVIVLQWIA